MRRVALAALALALAAAPRTATAGPEPELRRYVAITSEVPDHLEGALEELARFELLLLAPPERPPGTTDTVPDATRRTYDLLFTNDPEGERSHAEQVNVFVRGITHGAEPEPDATPTEVRGTTGSFSCGAAACFLSWIEGDVTYTVGEFGSPEEAVGFAESLRPIEDLAGPPRAPPSFPPLERGRFPWLLVGVILAAAALLGLGVVLIVRSRRPG